MAYTTYCILVVLAFVAYEQSFVEAACPMTQSAGEAEMKSCLASVGLSMDAGGAGTGMGGADQLKQFCEGGKLDQALNCVKAILDDCKNEKPEISDALSQVISIEKLRGGFKYLCENVQVLADNAQCMATAAEPMSTCIQTQTQKFQTEIQAKSRSGDMDKDDVWEMTCGFMDGIFRCQNDAYSSACGNEVADVMMQFMQSMRPPVCSQYSGATSILTSSWLMFSGLVVILFLQFKS